MTDALRDAPAVIGAGRQDLQDEQIERACRYSVLGIVLSYGERKATPFRGACQSERASALCAGSSMDPRAALRSSRQSQPRCYIHSPVDAEVRVLS